MNPLPPDAPTPLTGPRTFYSGHRLKSRRFVVEVTREGGDARTTPLTAAHDSAFAASYAWGPFPGSPIPEQLGDVSRTDRLAWQSRVEQLAFALLADHFRDAGVAMALYREFAPILEGFDASGGGGWTITDRQIDRWYHDRELRGPAAATSTDEAAGDFRDASRSTPFVRRD